MYVLKQKHFIAATYLYIYIYTYIYRSISIWLVESERKLRIIITDVVIYLMKHLTNLRVSEQYLYLYIYTIL